MQILYTHMQKHIQHNKDERHSSLEKIYLSLYWKGCVWEGVGDRTNTATYWPPTLLAITVFLSHSPGLLNRGPGGPASAGTWFSFQHLLSNCLTSCLTPGSTSTQFNPSTVKVASWYFRPDAPVIYTGAFLLLTAWPGSISNTKFSRSERIDESYV